MRKMIATLLSAVLCFALLAGFSFSSSAAELVPAESAAPVLTVASATASQGVTMAENGGVSYYNFGNNRADLSVSYKITVDHAGDYYVGILYNIGSNTTRYLNLSVNGGAAQPVVFVRNSNSWGDSTTATDIIWNHRIVSVALAKGENTITLALDGTNTAPMISDLTVWTEEEWLTANDNPTVTSATVATSDSGFDGVGYDVGSDTGTISWDVDITVPGTYKFSIAYSTSSGIANRPIEAVVDGTVVASISRAKNSTAYGNGWSFVTSEEITLEAGAASIGMQVAGSAYIGALRLELVESALPDDQIKDLTVSYAGEQASGEVYSLDIVWENDDFTFNYVGGTQGAWNPADHTYGGTSNAGWQDKDLKVTVTNHSNAAVKVTMEVTDGDTTDPLTVTSDKTTETLLSAEGTTVENAPKVDYTLTIDGTPTKDVTKVATATITFAEEE